MNKQPRIPRGLDVGRALCYFCTCCEMVVKVNNNCVRVCNAQRYIYNVGVLVWLLSQNSTRNVVRYIYMSSFIQKNQWRLLWRSGFVGKPPYLFNVFPATNYYKTMFLFQFYGRVKVTMYTSLSQLCYIETIKNLKDLTLCLRCEQYWKQWKSDVHKMHVTFSNVTWRDVWFDKQDVWIELLF